jgi:hypothetical protein
MGLALAVLLFLGMLTTIGIRILQPLVDTPDYTGNADRVGLSHLRRRAVPCLSQPAAVQTTGYSGRVPWRLLPYR